MGAKASKSAAWVCLLAGVTLVFGGLVWGTFGRNHTRTVTRTRTVTKVVTKKVNTKFTSASSLIEFLHPQQAKQAPCPSGMGTKLACFSIVGKNSSYFIFLATPK